METQTLVPLGLIDPNPYQPRQTEDLEAVKEIAESIRRNGLMQVPTARMLSSGRYQLAFGHTRLAAFKLIEQDCMPLIVRQLSDLQMFELGVAENIKRRDLNPIEQAEAMRRYMDEFDKNSVETGEFFNVSPEKVRQSVRLLNLPSAAQEYLASGEMTQTTARTVLSMQRVVPEDVLVETIEMLKKGVDRWGFKETAPDAIIEEVMDHLDDVKQLWSGQGKPRGGRSDAWLLDMKNFPNQFLPVLTPVDAAMALGIQDDEEMMEKVSTWIQASLGELPDLDTSTLGIPEDLLKKLEHLIKPPACTACPFYSVVQGTHYCGMEVCFNRKTRAWEYEQLRAATKDLKIEIYNAEADGEFRVLEDNYNSEGEHYKIFKSRSKDLRLALAVDIDRKKSQHGYNLRGSVVVMLVGKTLKDLLAKGQKERAAKRTKEQAAQLLARLLEEKREALDWELAGHVKILFDGMNLTALHALWETPGRYSNEWATSFYNMPAARKPKDAKDSEKADSYRLLMAFNMVRKIGGHYNKSISQYAAHSSEKVKSWGVKLPKSILKLAAEMDQAITAETDETEEE